MRKYNLSSLEKKAWEFAQKAHQGTFRKFTKDPYFEHVRKVFKLLKKVDTSEILAVASLLHDVIEDTKFTYDDIVREFGVEVANIVVELTSVDDILDAMGKPDYILDKMNSMSNGALLIKLCDRLQNISDHFTSSPEFREKYYKETKYIIDNLKNNRQLNKPQTIICNQITGILDNIPNRYRISKFHTFE